MSTATETYVPRLGDCVIADDGEGPIAGEVYALSGICAWVGHRTNFAGQYSYPLRNVEYSDDKAQVQDADEDEISGRWFDGADLTPAQPTEPQNATPSPSELSTDVTTLQLQVVALTTDLWTIGEHLKATAERHEWCGEYETHLSRLCDALSEEGAEALRSTAQRAKSFTVSYTITVEGSNRAEAIANAQREAQSGSGHWGASERDSNG